MRVERVDAATGLALVARERGSCWLWADALEVDPLASCFASCSAGQPSAVELSWCAAERRHVIAARHVRRGELLMVVPALVRVPLPGTSSAYDLAAIVRRAGTLDDLDEPTLALTVAVLEAEARSEHAGGSAPTAALAIARALVSNADQLPRERWDAWLDVGRLLRAALPTGLLPRSLDDASVARLLLSVKGNCHRVLDDETATRQVGLGLFPAACLLNHSCLPTTNLYFASNGTELYVRAIADIRPGEHVTCSYLLEENLYAPWAERASLLRSGHAFEPVEPPERARAEAASSGGGAASPLLERRLHSAIEAAEAACASGEGPACRSAAEALCGLVHTELEPSLHPAHWLLQEAAAALVALGRALDDPGLIGRYSLLLLTARESSLPRGTLHLAVLYAAHGSALHRMLRDGRVPDARRGTVAAQAAAAMRAAHRIRIVCLGEQHPLAKATAATAHAAERAAERAARAADG